MIEQEYIDLSDRVRVTSALQILSEIFPERSSVIDPLELQQVILALHRWEDELIRSLKIA